MDVNSLSVANILNLSFDILLGCSLFVCSLIIMVLQKVLNAECFHKFLEITF